MSRRLLKNPLNPAQVTLNYLTSQETLGVINPHSHNVVLGHVTCVISLPKYFFTSICPFATRFYLRSEIYISCKFCAVSVVISGQIGFALKFALKCQIGKWSEI